MSKSSSNLQRTIIKFVAVAAAAAVIWVANAFFGIDLTGGGESDTNQTTTSTSSSYPDSTTSTTTVDPPRTNSSDGTTTSNRSSDVASSSRDVRTDDADVIAQAYRAKRSSVMVEVGGVVTKSLPDDNEGSRHQRFIVRLSNGLTVLIAHNIDLAPYVPLEEGDTVYIKGEYEWNDQGGVIHWTHHDPGKRHPDGWIEHNGERYG